MFYLNRTKCVPVCQMYQNEQLCMGAVHEVWNHNFSDRGLYEILYYTP